MPRESSPSFIRTPINLAGVVGSFLGTDTRVLVENAVLGFTHYIEKLIFAVGPVAGAGAGATQQLYIRKGASAGVLATTTAADPAAGATNIKMTSVTGALVGMWLTLEGPIGVESRLITAVGTAGGAGGGIDVTPGFTLDHANGEVARVTTTPVLAVLTVTLANSTVGAVLSATVDPALERFARFADTEGFSIVRPSGGTVFTTEPSGTLLAVTRQKLQGRL